MFHDIEQRLLYFAEPQTPNTTCQMMVSKHVLFLCVFLVRGGRVRVGARPSLRIWLSALFVWHIIK